MKTIPSRLMVCAGCGQTRFTQLDLPAICENFEHHGKFPRQYAFFMRPVYPVAVDDFCDAVETTDPVVAIDSHNFQWWRLRVDGAGALVSP